MKETQFFESPTIVKIERENRKLTYNHYANCGKKIDVEVESMAIVGGAFNLGDTRQ